LLRKLSFFFNFRHKKWLDLNQDIVCIIKHNKKGWGSGNWQRLEVLGEEAGSPWWGCVSQPHSLTQEAMTWLLSQGRDECRMQN
jgi:hypothetical protein